MSASIVPIPSNNWRVHLFDGLRITADGCNLSLPPFRSQLLLVALLLKPSLKKRFQLAGLLFPDFSEQAAKARVSDLLWLIKRHLPDFPIFCNATELWIAPASLWVDVWDFRARLKRDEPGDLLQAIELYRGDLLPEQDNEWLLLERENLRLAFTRLLQTQSARLLQSGNHSQAIPMLEKLNQVEPFDESNLRSLLRAYQATGQRGAALSSFERYQTQVREEIGLDPEAATHAIIRAIQEQAVIPPPKYEEIELPDSPDNLLKHGQQALWQGDFRTLQACLDALPAPSEAADSLKVEWAILRGDFGTASRLLENYPPGASLTMTVQRIHLSVELKEFSDVVERCKPAIAEAHRQKNVMAETLLLVEQGLAYQRTGQSLDAMRCANQVITQAEKAGLAYPFARGYQLKGILQSAQGFERDAMETFHHALACSAENGFLPLLARAEGRLGINYQNAGKFHLSLEHYEQALKLMRDLGMRRDEAETLQNRGIVYDSLGCAQSAMLAYQQARDIFVTLDDEQGMARNTHHMAFGLALTENSDLDEALTLGKQALEIFKKHQSLGWIASTYGMLGYIYWLKGEPDAAICACKTAIPLYQQLEEADYIPELYGYIGLAYLQKDDPRKAVEYTMIAMDEMLHSELYDIASEIYFAHASALAALGQEGDSNDYFSRGYKNLLTYAEEIEDPEARQVIFRRDPTVRQLMEQVYARGIAPRPQVESHVAVTRNELPVKVALTLDAGAADVALKNARGPVALRRARLLRILKEARLQGGRLSASQLAVMMSVSMRTVERDLMLLRERREVP